jgi:hypothetical protein
LRLTRDGVDQKASEDEEVDDVPGRVKVGVRREEEAVGDALDEELEDENEAGDSVRLIREPVPKGMRKRKLTRGHLR